MKTDYSLLENLCAISAPTSDESRLTQFILDYVAKNASSWKQKPKIFAGDDLQECIMLVWGTPRTAMIAHIDSVGFMVGYFDELLSVGSPRCETGTQLVGYQEGKMVTCTVQKMTDEDGVHYKIDNPSEQLERGTLLTYKPDFHNDGEFIESPFLDDRVGVYVALRLAETMENGAIIFSTGEETAAGNVKFCWRILYEQFKVKNALISDITWITEGIQFNKGCVVSFKDTNIPRRKFIDRIVEITSQENLAIQREVETAGGSDGATLQRIPYPVNWCFVGAAELHPHSPLEKIATSDVESMYMLYNELMKQL